MSTRHRSINRCSLGRGTFFGLVSIFFILLCAAPAAPADEVTPAEIPAGELGPACSREQEPPVQTIRRDARSQTVRTSATVLASEDEAPSRARARAEAKAMRRAVEAVGGVSVKSGLLSFDQLRGADSSMLIQEFIATRVDALVIDKKVVSTAQPGGLEGAGYCYGVVLEATVLDRSRNTDPGFEVEVSLDRVRLVSGDPVEVWIESSRNARIYLIGLYEDGMAVLLPNRFREDTRVQAGKPLVFPDTKRGEGERLLRAQVPEGRTRTTEVLLAIAIRDDGRLDPKRSPRKGTFETVESGGAGALLEDYLRPLTHLPPHRWAFDQIAYEIWAP